jgi:nucleoside phosphorylase
MANEHLSPASLTWALHHIEKFGDTDLFPPLFEFDLIRKCWNEFLPTLARENLTTYEWRTPRQWLIPKDQVSFRTATQLDPIDSIVFTAIVHDSAPELEKRRVSTQKEAIYSYRISTKADGTLYEPHTRRAFWAKSKALTYQYQHVAILDISDFYNQIEHSAVLGQLEAASIPPVRRTLIEKLLRRTSDTTSRGIPIGPQASHLLAEAALIPLDNFLLPQHRFTRYADDIHVFCKSYADAQTAIFQIADYLNKNQRLSLNRQKTDVKTSIAFRESASRMLIDDPINKAEERMLEALREHLEESGELEEDDYADVQLSDLDRADAALFSAKLLESVLKAYLSSNSTSYLRLRWFLRRITKVGAAGAVEYVASHIDSFAPAIVDAVRYLSSAAAEYSGSWEALGERLIKSLNNPLIRASDYLQVSIIGLFWRITDLNHARKLLKLFQGSGPSIRREIVLAASIQAGPDWVRQQIPDLSQMDVWLRRAVLHSMRELPEADRRRYSAKTIRTPEDLMTNSLLNIADARSTAVIAENGAQNPPASRPAIGIITALPKEMAAMRTMVSNSQRATINRAGGMKECYLGQMPARDGGEHRIALALSGMGNNQAAARAITLLRDFPSIKHIFMVGIAGGIPNPASAQSHVRLGDVVVSGEHGVMQYDLVKESKDKVEHRNPPRPPSSSVLEAVKFLESELLSGQNPLPACIAAGLTTLHVRRPPSKSDFLGSTRDTRAPARKVRHPRDRSRTTGQPKVFVGPIASANVLLKNSKKRDELRDKFGVKAVEMEGSGIADASWDLEVGYLVIRGICDYCDGHKNDRWQQYAAVVAAAYTRVLLESMPAEASA